MNLRLNYYKGIMGRNGWIREEEEGSWSSWKRIWTSAESLSMADRKTEKTKEKPFETRYLGEKNLNVHTDLAPQVLVHL